MVEFGECDHRSGCVGVAAMPACPSSLAPYCRERSGPVASADPDSAFAALVQAAEAPMEIEVALRAGFEIEADVELAQEGLEAELVMEFASQSLELQS